MSRILYDLCGIGDRRFSPYCWRTKLALRHKHLDFDAKPLRFTDIDGLSDKDEIRLTLPTLEVDGERVTDSWVIAKRLETSHPNQPPLFPHGEALPRFVQAWTDTVVNPALIRVILMDVFNCLDDENQAFFRLSREKRFGVTLEAFTADADGALRAFQQSLQPIRNMLNDQPFLDGLAPAYADFIPASAFLWARAVGRNDLLDESDPIGPWLDQATANVDVASIG